MGEIKKLFPYLFIFILTFASMAYLSYILFWLFFVIPFVCFVNSLVYGLLNRSAPNKFLFPICAVILIAVTMFAFFRVDSLFYTLFYIIMVLGGYAVGYEISVKISRFIERKRSKE